MARTGTHEEPGWWPLRALMSRMVYLLLRDDRAFPLETLSFVEAMSCEHCW